MAITASDIKWKLSVKTGSAGNSTAQADPDASLGKYISTTEWAGGVLNDLFDDVTGDENAASESEYRCVFIHNSHGTLTTQNGKLWIQSEVAGGASMAIALDGVGVTAIGSASAQADEVADEDTAPTGETFSSPTTKAAGISIPDLAPGQCVAIWVRRTTANTSALNNDGCTLRFEFDTAA